MATDDRDLDLDPPQPLALSDNPPQRLIDDIAFTGPPSIDFWENRLESPARRLCEDAADPRSLDTWITQRKPRHLAMLCRLLGFRSKSPPGRNERA